MALAKSFAIVDCQDEVISINLAWTKMRAILACDKLRATCFACRVAVVEVEYHGMGKFEIVRVVR
jgi:hypothetical protein